MSGTQAHAWLGDDRMCCKHACTSAARSIWHGHKLPAWTKLFHGAETQRTFGHKLLQQVLMRPEVGRKVLPPDNLHALVLQHRGAPFDAALAAQLLRQLLHGVVRRQRALRLRPLWLLHTAEPRKSW